VVYTIDGYRVGELVREIIRRARACRWKPHAALFKLNPVRIIIGGQLGTPASPPLPRPRPLLARPSSSLPFSSFCPPEPRLIPRDRICEYEKEKKNQTERGRERERERKGEGERERERERERGIEREKRRERKP